LRFTGFRSIARHDDSAPAEDQATNWQGDVLVTRSWAMVASGAAANATLPCRAMNARDWIDAYAERLGVPSPTAEEFKTLLEIAAEAAHASERIAAPVACWLCARSGRSVDESLAIARDVAGGSDTPS
jgi:hypothetical protein